MKKELGKLFEENVGEEDVGFEDPAHPTKTAWPSSAFSILRKFVSKFFGTNLSVKEAYKLMEVMKEMIPIIQANRMAPSQRLFKLAILNKDK